MPSLRPGGAWAALVLLSALLAIVLERASVPAAMMLGPMLVAVAFALRGVTPTVPKWAFPAAQAVIGCLVARTITPSTLATLVHSWPVMLLVVCMIVASGALVALGLMRLGSLPGDSAAWGTSPGGAAAMTAVADAYGQDVRVVAFMLYLRVFIVVVTASAVSRLLLGHAATPLVHGFDPGLDAPLFPLAQTVALMIASIFITRWLRIPAGALLLSMVGGAALGSGGLVALTLPPWMLWAGYAVIGWYVGLRFDRETVRHVLRLVPQLLLATLTLILLCCGAAWVLTIWVGVDPLSAYLSTSPGGLDTVAAIAVGSGCDVPFVLALQTLRLFAVVLCGPLVARLVTRLGSRSGSARR
jgi:membrane AbrB-like protein